MKIYVVVCHYEDWGNEDCEVGCPDNCYHVVDVFDSKVLAEKEAIKHEKEVENKKNIHPLNSCWTEVIEKELREI